MKDRVEQWNDEYQQQFLTAHEERMMQDSINEILEEEFQLWLQEALAPQEGYNIRSERLRELVSDVHKQGHTKVSYAGLGEYLYLLVHDALTATADYNLSRLERD